MALYDVKRTYSKGNVMAISPEAADFLRKLRDDTSHMTIMTSQYQRDLLQRVHKWLDATIDVRIASARAAHAHIQSESLRANPVTYYVAGFPQFHEWLVKERRELLRLSEVQKAFDLDIDKRWLISMIDTVRNNATAYDLPRLVLVQEGEDAAIICVAS